MDPFVTMDQIISAVQEYDFQTAREHLETLEAWHKKGGYRPKTFSVLIRQDGAAFDGALEPETARILGEYVKQPWAHNARDVNGNTCAQSNQV